MDRYIGMDVHSASCTAGVLSAKGSRLKSVVLETNGKVLVEFLKTIPSKRHLIIEEGTHSNWLYEILSPHVHEMTVIGVPKNKGQKNDKLDSFGLAEKLRVGSIETRVYKGLGNYAALNATSKAYRNVMIDSVRVMNRLRGRVSFARHSDRRQKDLFSVEQRQVACKTTAEDTAAGKDLLHRTRNAHGVAKTGSKRNAKRSEEAQNISRIENGSRHGTKPRSRAASHHSHAVSVSKQENVLDILRTWRGNAKFIGLGSGSGWFLDSHKHTADARIELQSQSFLEKDIQRCRNNSCWAEEERRSCLSTLLVAIRKRNQSDSCEADDCSSDCIDNSLDIANRRRIRREEIEKEITRFQIGTTACESIGNWQRDIWRRKGFRGEYHLFGWSQNITLESPNVGLLRFAP